MTNRKQNDVEAFLSDIDRKWQLSLNEREYLKKVFNKILSGINTADEN